MNRLEKQISFIKEIEKLKTVKRQNSTLDNNRPENSAEHSWHLAMMAMLLMDSAKDENIDQLKVIKMLLVHDLVEIYAGDAFLFDEEERSEAHKKEETALIKLTSLLPEDQANEIEDLWMEFEQKKTEESKFADSLDALQPLLNHLQTAKENDNPHGIKIEQVYEKKKKILTNTPKLWDIAEDTIKKSEKRGLYS